MLQQPPSEPPAELMISLLVKALEVNFVEIDPGPQVLQDLRSGVAVGNKSSGQPSGLGFLENGHGPF